MRVLLLINATLDPALQDAVAAGTSPRKDYLELQRVLGADVIDLSLLDRTLWTRLVRRAAGTSFAQALLGWLWSARYDAVFADRESTGFALAALFKLRRRRPRLVMIGHLLSSPRKQVLFRGLRLQDMVDQVIVHSTLQQRIAERGLGVPADHIAVVPYQTDPAFWTPRAASPKKQICSAGLEYRDYATLVAACAGLDVDVVIAAASLWSKHRGLPGTETLPPNVRMVTLQYAALRQLYAESLFTAVPLLEVDNQAGITTILEAMAMGKAVVVSHTRGQTDVVRDRRRRDRSAPQRETQPDWARTLGAAEATATGHTGIYVRPGDPAELRRAIEFLLAHPEQAHAMGANGRRLIEEVMGLDHFTARVAALVRGEPVVGVSASDAAP